MPRIVGNKAKLNGKNVKTSSFSQRASKQKAAKFHISTPHVTLMMRFMRCRMKRGGEGVGR